MEGNIYTRKLPKIYGTFKTGSWNVYDLYKTAGPYEWSLLLSYLDIYKYYEQCLIKKGQKLKAKRMLSEIIVKCKEYKEKKIPAFIFFYICAYCVTPPWTLREVVLGGIKYRVAWYIFRQKRLLYSFTWYKANCKVRRVKPIKYKMVDLMVNFWNFEGKAWDKKWEYINTGIENRGFIHFLKD